MKKSLFVWTLLFVLLSAFLQFYQLGERSLWEYEARVAIKNDWSLEEILLVQKNALYHLLLSSWSRFGKDEFWLRIPSALFALFSLVALYELGKILFSKKVGLLATGFLSISPFFLLETRQVKMYSLALFFSLVSLYFLIQFLETGRIGKLLGHIGISAMAILTHYMFFPVLFLEWVVVLLEGRKKPILAKRYFTGWLVLLVFFLPSLPSFLIYMNFMHWLHIDPKTAVPFSFPLGYLGKVASAYYLFTVGPTIFPWNFFFSSLGFLLPTLLLFRLFLSPISQHLKWTFLAFILPIFSISLLRNAPPLYTFVSLPFYALLLSASLFRLQRLTRTFFLAGLLLVNGYGLANYFLGRQYLFIAYLEPYREIAQTVQQNFLPGDVIVHTQENPSFNYYFNKLFQRKIQERWLRKQTPEGKIHLRDWEEVAEGFPKEAKRLWFLERPPGQHVQEIPIADPEKIYRENLAFREFLDGRFKRIGRWGYLQDPDIEKKEKFVRKFYLKERITLSLYDLTSPP